MVTWYVPGLVLPATAVTTVTGWPLTVTIGRGLGWPLESIAPRPGAKRERGSPGNAGAEALTMGVPLTTRWATTFPWPLPSTLKSAGAYWLKVMGKAADVST